MFISILDANGALMPNNGTNGISILGPDGALMPNNGTNGISIVDNTGAYRAYSANISKSVLDTQGSLAPYQEGNTYSILDTNGAFLGSDLFTDIAFSLFSNGEQGVWYDPSDLSTLYQDSTGTTPVTAVEQPVGLMLDKRFGKVRGPELSSFATGFDHSVGWQSQQAITSIVNREYYIVSDDPAGLSDRSELTVSGLTIGKLYEVKAVVRRGAQGSTQKFDLWTFGTINKTNITSTTNAEYKFLVIATATSGLLRIYANETGVIGDSVIVNSISIREIQGNHASQPISASRPTLSARVNLIVNSENYNGSGWAKSAGGTGTAPIVDMNYALAPDGTMTAARLQTFKGAGNLFADFSFLRQSVVNTTGSTRPSVTSIWLKSNTGVSQRVYCSASSTQNDVTTVGTEWQQFSFPASVANGESSHVSVGSRGIGGDVIGDCDLLIWHPQIEVGTVATRYQRVVSATEYDTVGFPVGLSWDGVDDGMSTAAINFSPSAKMTIFAGLRKLSDAATGTVVEATVNSSGASGTFCVWAPNGAQSYQCRSLGTIDANTSPDGVTMYPAPHSAVLTMQSAIDTDLLKMRINGVQRANITSDQGDNTYGNHALYIGARAGTTLFYNGLLYGLIVRGATSTDAQVSSVEAGMASKSGATLVS